MKFKKSINSTAENVAQIFPASRIPVDGNTYDLVLGAQYKKAGDTVVKLTPLI
jgi:hypothetical protein